jgi:HD-GYP domain-containing protein (c-di-GMP phosphodiesterase class II)
VADTYDAITSERPYRKAMDSRIAFNIIDGCKGSQFDPEIIDAFFKNQENSHHLTDKT